MGNIEIKHYIVKGNGKTSMFHLREFLFHPFNLLKIIVKIGSHCNRGSQFGKAIETENLYGFRPLGGNHLSAQIFRIRKFAGGSFLGIHLLGRPGLLDGQVVGISFPI